MPKKGEYEGTVKFELLLYGGKLVKTGDTREPKAFVYQQRGMIRVRDEKDNPVASKHG